MSNSSWSFRGWLPSLSSSSRSSSPISFLRQFSSTEIRKATNNFDNSKLLWRGYLNDVYKGTYHDDNDGTEKIVTIKCFHFNQQARFKEEMYLSSQYRHKHVVMAIGYCHEPPDTNVIIYEYMPNGSLANGLCTKITPTTFHLSWEQCLEICIDAARGLEYMHTHVRHSNGDSFHHCDITVSNIMLDGNGVAKISDIYYEPRGYEPAIHFAPEYHSSGRVSQSSDVYAFGVLLVKVLSRKVSFNMEDRYIGKWLKKCIINGRIDELLHPAMKPQIPTSCLKAFLSIVGECLVSEMEKRPSFTQVVKKLIELSKVTTKISSKRLCPHYSFKEIEDITNNFESILGEGGEGKVYKGLTRTNISVAVKCLKPEHSSEFEREIKMLSDLHHPNLVSLVGYCHGSDEDQNILMYEFMCNGNLAQHLYGRRSSCLSWKKRLNICIGAARGLSYLHTSTRKGIIHRDVKPANILLDKNFNAKISDFGLSKMIPQDQSNSTMPTKLKGTTGYYAPEYQRYSQITRKIDVYALGVVLFEVLCRKMPWDREESFYPAENEKYGQWAKQNIDSDLKGEIAPVCVEAFTDVLEKCLNGNPKKRPSMINVVSVLEYALTWQEAWQRHKSQGLVHLPGVAEDSVVLYYSSTPLQQEQGTSTIEVRLLLRRLLEFIDERDTTKHLYATELKQVLGNTVDIHMTHLFVRGKYVGDINVIKKLYEAGELAKLCGSSHPKFICDDCGEAKSCGDCKQTKWYIHCKECEAFGIVRGQSQIKLIRSCLECHGTQLISGSHTEKPKGRIRQYIARGAAFVTSMFQ